MQRGHHFPSVVAPVIVGLVGVVLSLWILPPTTSQLGPTTVELSGKLGIGRTYLQVTPFGTVSARTHAGPLDLTAALKQVDIEALGERITTPRGRAALQDQVEREIPALLLRTTAKEVIAAGVVAALLGAALFRHRRHAAAVAGISGVVGSLVLLGVAGLTFDQSGFDQARFSGSLAKARQVIATVTQHSATFDEARSRYEVAARRVSNLMVLLARPDIDPATQTTALLHVSDIHANPIGLEIAEELAREFDVAGVIDTGDLASSFLDTGELSSLAGPVDRLMVQGIQRLGLPYVFVSGNHDSPKLLAAIRRADNAMVLDGETVRIADIEILGWGDPTYSTFPIPESEKAEERAEYTDDVAAAVAAARPDVLAVHDAVLGADSVGLVPVVVSGHFHRRVVSESDGTRFLAVGSTGATGVKSLTVEADLLYEAEILYFDEDQRLVAVDYVTLEGLGEDFTLERNSFGIGVE